MRRTHILKIATLVMATFMLTLTSCTKEVTDYLIGQWNEQQVTITYGSENKTQKLNGNYIFKDDNSVSYTHVKGSQSKTEKGTWTFFDNVGSLWLTFPENGKEITTVIHIDQIDKSSMQWTKYEKNENQELITYVYKFNKKNY